MKARLFVLGAAAVFGLACGSAEGKVVSRQGNRRLLASGVQSGMERAISQDGSLVAHTVYTGTLLQSRHALFVGKKKLHEAERIGNLTFSLDAKHLGFVAKVPGPHPAGVFLDGSMLGSYDDAGVRGLVFNPEGERLAYTAKMGDKWRVFVVDTVTRGIVFSSKPCDDLGEKVSFSVSGPSVAFNCKSDARWRVVIDGVEQEPYLEIGKGSFTFNPVDEGFSYAAKVNERWAVVNKVNGNTHRSVLFDGLIEGTLIYGPHGQRAYAVADDDAQYVVLNGAPQHKYKKIGSHSLAYSPDGKRFGYAAFEESAWFLVVDGKKQKAHDSLYSGPIFSKTGAEFAYVAGEGGKMQVFRERGRPSRQYDAVLSETVSFSPDEKSLAFVGRRGSLFSAKRFMVVDEAEGADYDDVLSLNFQYFVLPDFLSQLSQPKRRSGAWVDDATIRYTARIGEQVYEVVEPRS